MWCWINCISLVTVKRTWIRSIHPHANWALKSGLRSAVHTASPATWSLQSTTLFSAAVKLLRFALCSYTAQRQPLRRNMPIGTDFVHSCAIQTNMSWLRIRTGLKPGRLPFLSRVCLSIWTWPPHYDLDQRKYRCPGVAESFAFPDSFLQKMGRLVGCMELQKGKTRKTVLDVTPANCYEAIVRQHWGNLRQQLQEHHAPVSSYGPLIIGKPHDGLRERKNPGSFGQKLAKRPLALRCGTEYIQSHEMFRIVLRYLDRPVASPSYLLSRLLSDGSPFEESVHIAAVTQLWHSPPFLGLMAGNIRLCNSI